LIVLVSIDTLRADHVAGFGGRTDLTPELARRGAEGLLFTAASSEGIWTLPSHSALLFSRFPGLDPVERDSMSMTLAEAFSSAGFATLGLTGGGWVSAKLGFSKGFDHYAGVGDHDDDFRGLIEGEMLSMIERFASVPTFLFLHTYSVHRQTQAIRNWIRRVRYIRSPENRARAREMAEHYAELVREADTDLAVLFSTLARQASKRPVLLVLISDHGQALGEHGFVDHGVTVPLFDELVHVPFLVWGPGIVPAQRTSSFSVSLADVAPSLLASAGIAIPPNMQGTNLWPLWSGSNTENTTHAAPRGVTHHKRYWSLRSASRKLIVGLRKGRDPDIFLFDLAADPLERINLASSRPEEVLVLRGQLEARLRELGIKEMISTDKLDSNDHIDTIVLEDEKLRDRLRALGYLE
jgi:arylsulfatase A-like enzyme